MIDIVRHGSTNIHAKSGIQYKYCARTTIAKRPTVNDCDMSAAPDSTTPTTPRAICHSPRARDRLEPRPFQQKETV